MSESLKFTVVDAFTNRPFGGNPAAVVVLPKDKTYSDSILQGIALEFNLSETAFISHPSPQSTATEFAEGAKPVSFGLRWFTPSCEVPLCGHATLASAAVLFSDPALVSQDVNEIHFSTMSGIMKAHRVPGSARVELVFPVGEIVEADAQTLSNATDAVREAIGVSEATVNFVGVCGVKPYDTYILVELDTNTDLSKLVVDATILERKQPNHPITVLTTRTKSHTGEAYQLRVFALGLGIAEDPVTGSANSFAAKYWATRLNVPSGEEFAVQQVSARIGDIGLVWDGSVARLRGQSRVASRGEIYV